MTTAAILATLRDRLNEILSRIEARKHEDDIDQALAKEVASHIALLEKIGDGTAPKSPEQPTRQPRGPNAKPDNLTASWILNALKEGARTEKHLIERCAHLGGDAKVTKATLKDMLKNDVIIMLPDGYYAMPPVGQAAE